MSDEEDYLRVDLGRGGEKRLEDTFKEELENDLSSIPVIDVPKKKYLFEVNFYLNYIEPEYVSALCYFDSSMPNISEVRQKIVKHDSRLQSTPTLLKIENIKPVLDDQEIVRNFGDKIQYF